VNAVGFVDESSDIFFSGTDDGIIKVWDRRCLNETRPEPVGLLIGHRDGVTYIDSKNDGRFLLSNSKDQSIKLWDLRMFSPKDSEDSVLSASSSSTSWDYRWDKVPKRYYSNMKPIEGDTSVMTYRGHRVQKSLIRARFSPVATTGQRYIYSGCSSGRLIIYDVLTGKMIPTGGIEGHTDIIRDVAWHPHRNEILTSSWDYQVNLNSFQDKTVEKKRQRRKLYPHFTDGVSLRDTDDESMAEAEPPLRRSRRIANRNRRSENLNRFLNLMGPDSSDDDNVDNSGAAAQAESSRNQGESSNSVNDPVAELAAALPSPPSHQIDDMDSSSDSEGFRGFETNEQRPTVINLEISGRPPILRFQRFNRLRRRGAQNPPPNNNSRS
jgi:hypothetical protein